MLSSNSSNVLPKSLPPEVAKRTMVSPLKSYDYRKELIMCGATHHQIGKPTKIISASATGTLWSVISSLEILSCISTELRDFLSIQFSRVQNYLLNLKNQNQIRCMKLYQKIILKYII